MIKPITFCIASANNEREYTKLLLRSLKDHTQVDLHEILVFIDSDNQNTYEALQEIQKQMPTLKLCKNPNPFPIGSQRNVSVMFNAAKNDIVCYLQSDMVVGKDFDKHISDSLISDKMFICGTRIEPPVHPESPDKFTQNFGLDTNDFSYSNFNSFVNQIQQQNIQDTDHYSVPFALYKKTWLDTLGGYDTQFRCSHEDIDSVVRMQLAGIQIKQSWKALVYHFTCVSSRGVDWFKNNTEAQYKNEIQHLASHQEARRYLRKWGTLDRDVTYRYNIGLELVADRYVDLEFLKHIEPHFDTISIPDAAVANQLASQLTFDSHYYSNLRWKYSQSHWDEVKPLFNLTDFNEKITTNTIDTDVVVSCKYSDLVRDKQQSAQLIQSMQELIHANEVGNYEYGYFTIDIKQKTNHVMSLVKCNNLQTILQTNQPVDFI